MAEREEGEPVGGEEHPLPSATIWPLGFAAGVAVFLVGLGLTNWVVFAIGLGLAIVFGALWAYDAVREHRPKAPAPEPEAVEEEEEEELERFGRNVFLERTTLGLGALIGAAVTVPVAGFVIAPAFTEERNEDEDVELGPLANFPEGQYVVATFQSKQREGDVSMRTAFVRNNGVANGVPSFTILSNRCVHLGCPTQPGGLLRELVEVETEAGGKVELVPTQGTSGFTCPCHAGQYNAEGDRTAGPPVRALDRYTYSIINGSLVLGPRYSVGKVRGSGANASIVSYTRFDPGQHVDGPVNWLNPVSPQQIYEPNPND